MAGISPAIFFLIVFVIIIAAAAIKILREYERGVSWVEMDGQRMRDGVIPLDRDLVKHRILVHMGKPEQAP